MTEPVIICSVCRNALDIYTGEDGGQYWHTIQDADDHAPVPIIADTTWRGRCDFCNTGEPAFRLPARDFEAPGMPGAYSKGSWATCPTCAQLVDTDQWSALARRAITAYQAAHGPMGEAGRTAIRSYYRALRKNVTGSLVRLPERKESQ